MRKLAITLLLLCSLFVNTAFAESMILEYDGSVHNYTGDVYALVVNGKTLNNLPLNPIIFNERAVVPVREVFEALGATVNYYGDKNLVEIQYGDRNVKMVVGESSAIVDGVRKPFPDGVGAKFIGIWGENAKTMVPVRFISENIGLHVGYNGQKKTITVSEEYIPIPDVTEPVVNGNATINSINYKLENGVVTVTVTSNNPVEKLSKGAMTPGGVVYADIYGAKHSLNSRYDVNLDVVSAVRVGTHDEYTRIAIDTNGVKKYEIHLTEDKKTAVFLLSGDDSANFGAFMPGTATQSPVVTPTPVPIPVPTPDAPASITYNPEKIVVLDAGHGGGDPGASSYLMTEAEKAQYYAALASPESLIAYMSHGSGQKINEKDVALIVAEKVKANLEANGITVIMTRDGDFYPSLDSRPALANSIGAVIFVSIHLNSTTTEVTAAKGIEIYYSTQNNRSDLGINSQFLAQTVLNSMIESTNAKSRGVKTGNLLVNRECLMPSALIELGFMNNPDELENMVNPEYQDKLAAGIARGIISTYNNIQLP